MARERAPLTLSRSFQRTVAILVCFTGVSEIASAAEAVRFGERWLNQYQVGYSDFDDEDRSALREFSLLWSIFETQAMLGDMRIEAMISYIDEFAKVAESEGRPLQVAPFIPHLAYFRGEFVDDDSSSTNDVFNSLGFQQREHKDLVSHALIKLNDETPELVKALLIIVYNLRENLFRSLNWQHCPKKQRDDLYHASKVLMKAADLART